MKNLHDPQLIHEYRSNGSLKALEVLISRYTPHLRRMISQKISNFEDQQDTYQSLVICIAEKLDTHYEERGLFVFWLNKITINAINAYYRKKQTTLITNVEDIESISTRDDVNEFWDGGCGDELLKDLSHKVLCHEFNLLEDDMKELLCLIYKEHLTFREIGKRKGIPFTTLYKRYIRCCKHLKKKIEQVVTAPFPLKAFDAIYSSREMPDLCKWTKYFF